MNYDPIHDTYVQGKDSAPPQPQQVVPGPPRPFPPPVVPVQQFQGNKQPPFSFSNGASGPPPHMLYSAATQSGVPYVYQQVMPGQPLQQMGVAVPFEASRKLPHRRRSSVSEDDLEAESSVSPGGEDDEFGSRKKRKYPNSTMSKPRHLKKSDGEPFWRKDIQYDFLRFIFADDTRCFTNYFPHSDVPGAINHEKLTFSELYIRTIAESSKCSRVLKERLLRDHNMGLSVAIVTLLVNTGRMNTTINFVPEMRSSLRTFHSIPSLQADPQGGSATTPLQDTPRLKSILKAVCEVDTPTGPKDIKELVTQPPEHKPNLNVFQLVFLLSMYQEALPFYDVHDEANAYFNDFMALFLNPLVHPQNRAKRFLWLMHTYLETNFKPEQIAANPFGSIIPPKQDIPPNEAVKFDVDTPAEIAYSQQMYQTRVFYVHEDEQNVPVARRSSKMFYKPIPGSSAPDDDEATVAAPDLPGDQPKTKHEDGEEHEEEPDPDFEDEAPVASSPVMSPEREAVVEPVKKKPVKRKPAKAAVEADSLRPELLEHQRGPGFSQFHPTPEAVADLEAFMVHQQQNYGKSLSFPTGWDQEVFESVTPVGLTPADILLSSGQHNELSASSKGFIKEVRTSSKASTASFNKKTTILGVWIYRYFKYKRSIGNKLVGVEWEDIRYDMVHGIEEALYAQYGKSLNITPAEAATVSSAVKDETMVAQHDFNRISERQMFVLQLVTHVNDWLVREVTAKGLSRPPQISFDLDGSKVVYN